MRSCVFGNTYCDHASFVRVLNQLSFVVLRSTLRICPTSNQCLGVGGLGKGYGLQFLFSSCLEQTVYVDLIDESVENRWFCLVNMGIAEIIL